MKRLISRGGHLLAILLLLGTAQAANPALRLQLRTSSGTVLSTGSVRFLDPATASVVSGTITANGVNLDLPKKYDGTGLTFAQLLPFEGVCQGKLSQNGNQATTFIPLKPEANVGAGFVRMSLGLNDPNDGPDTLYLAYATSALHISGALKCAAGPAPDLTIDLDFKPGWHLLHIHPQASSPRDVSHLVIDNIWIGNDVPNLVGTLQ